MLKKLLCLLIMLLLCIPAAATEIPDTEQTGSITFLIDYDGQPLDGGSLEMYRVAALVLEEEAPCYVIVEELAELAPDLGDLSDPSLAETFAQLLEQVELEARSAAIDNGEAHFPDLQPGVYLVIQRPENATEGYSALYPFLVSLPQWREDHYAYDLTLEPKVAPEPEPTEPSEPTEPTEPTDPTEPTIPQTGQTNQPIPPLAVSGFGLFVLGFYLCFGKRANHEK